MSKLSILIVDDEANVTQSLARNLRDQFEVFTANSGLEALEILSQHDIAIILADQRMPGMEGVELLKAAQKISPESRSIIISGYSDIAALVTALNISSIRGYLSKPWDMQELREKLDNAAFEYTAIFHDASVVNNSADFIAELQGQIEDLKRLIETIQLEEDGTLEEQESRRKRALQHEQETLTFEQLYKAQNTQVSRQSFGLLRLQESTPEDFTSIVTKYCELLEKAFEQRVYKISHKISSELRNLAEELGYLRAGPRDVIEIHNKALQLLAENQSSAKHQVFHEEGKLLVLELMGYLVLFYQRYFPRY
jgi:YesN/AraC family two-component response regulator